MKMLITGSLSKSRTLHLSRENILLKGSLSYSHLLYPAPALLNSFRTIDLNLEGIEMQEFPVSSRALEMER